MHARRNQIQIKTNCANQPSKRKNAICISSWPRFALVHLRASASALSVAAAGLASQQLRCGERGHNLRERFLFITYCRGTLSLTLIRDEELTCAIIPQTYTHAPAPAFMGGGELSALALVLILPLPTNSPAELYTRGAYACTPAAANLNLSPSTEISAAGFS